MGIAELILNVAAMMILPTSLVFWVVYLGQMVQGKDQLPWTARRPVPWQFLDLLLVMFVSGVTLISLQQLAAWWFGIDVSKLQDDQLPVNEHFTILLAMSVGFVVATLLTLLMIRLRVRATSTDFGFDFRLRDLRDGFCGFVMLIVPVILVQFVLTQIFPNAANHPFVDLIRKDPNPVWLLGIFFAAVVVAPITEEILFRVVLQGWLERLMVKPDKESELATANLAEEPASAASDNNPFDRELSSNPYVSPLTASVEVNESELPNVQSKRTSWGPIILSSAAFSLAHFSHGTAPVSLFLLAMGIGYIYQRTHRIWPGVLIHALVNSLAMIQLAILIQQPS